MIYFARHAYGGPIKIGNSEAIGRRLKMLGYEYKHRIVLVGIMDGGEREEKLLHRFFSSLRITGEWFVPARCIFDFIAVNTHPWDGTDPPLRACPEHKYQSLASASLLLAMTPHRLKQEIRKHRIPVQFSGRIMLVETKHLKQMVAKEA